MFHTRSFDVETLWWWSHRDWNF